MLASCRWNARVRSVLVWELSYPLEDVLELGFGSLFFVGRFLGYVGHRRELRVGMEERFRLSTLSVPIWPLCTSSPDSVASRTWVSRLRACWRSCAHPPLEFAM